MNSSYVNLNLRNIQGHFTEILIPYAEIEFHNAETEVHFAKIELELVQLVLILHCRSFTHVI